MFHAPYPNTDPLRCLEHMHTEFTVLLNLRGKIGTVFHGVPVRGLHTFKIQKTVALASLKAILSQIHIHYYHSKLTNSTWHTSPRL